VRSRQLPGDVNRVCMRLGLRKDEFAELLAAE
jgi:hypothetical protein